MIDEQTGVTEEPMPPVGEIQTESEESQIPQAEVQETDEIAGLKEALQAEREKSRQAEEKAKFIENYYSQQAQKPAEEPKPDYDPDDLVTYRDVEKTLASRFEKIENQMRESRVMELEAQARRTHADYDDVFENFKKMVQGDPANGIMPNPGLYTAVMATSNPAETAYTLGCSHPNHLKKLQQQAAKSTVEKISDNLNKPPTLSDIAASSAKSEVDRWTNATDEEIEAEIARRKGWT